MEYFPSIWCIVPCFNRTVNTLRFLNNFYKQTYNNKHIVIVDDLCTDNTGFNVELNYPDCHVLYGEGDLWWAGGTNLGVQYALDNGADYILSINDDSQFSEDLIEQLYYVAEKNPKYIVGAIIVEENRENIVWSVGSSHDFSANGLMKLNYAGEHVKEVQKLESPHQVEMMPGNGVLIPSCVFKEIGLYDEVNFPQYHADSEFIKRASLYGYEPVINLNAIIVNQIIKKPLVDNVNDLIFSKKSDLYWSALATFFLRYYPNIDLKTCFNKLYSPFGVKIYE